MPVEYPQDITIIRFLEWKQLTYKDEINLPVAFELYIAYQEMK